MSGFSPRFTVNNCLADGNGVVIHPDGSLYACEQFPSNSRFGDVWNGVTDPDAKHAFCRTDITREECRNCAFLPVCTSFASCGVREYRCREMHELLTVYALRRLVSRKSTIDPADFDIPSC